VVDWRSSFVRGNALIKPLKKQPILSPARGRQVHRLEQIHSCSGGYAIEGEDARTWAKIAGYVCLGIAAVWLLGIIIMFCRIRLAIAINQVACMFMYHNPSVLLVPVFQNVIGIIWIFLWLFCAAFLLSQTADDVVPSDMYATYDIAYGTADTAGKCTDSWPSGGVYVDISEPLCSAAAAGTAPTCYKCSTPRFQFDWKFGYSFLAFLWHNFFRAVHDCRRSRRMVLHSIGGEVEESLYNHRVEEFVALALGLAGVWFSDPRHHRVA